MSLAKPVLVVGGATMASRLLGFARDIMIAAALGTGPVADAFFVAFRLPNLFRRTLGEGALNAAFVPVYHRVKAEDGPRAALGFARRAFTLAAIGLTGLAILGIVIAPALVLMLAGGFRDNPEKFALAVDYTRLAFPFVALAALASLMAAALNAERRFGSAALAPVVVNIALVGLLGIILASGLAQEPGARLLALGVSLAGVLQLIWLTLALRRSWGRWPFGRPVWSPDIARLSAMAIPGVIASGATQLAIVVATLVASTVPGAVSWLYYADRVYQLPLGFVAVAMGTVLLPDLAARVRAGDHDGERTTIDTACEMALLLTVPAGVALAILAEPIVVVLFERGAFSAQDSAATAAALRLLALGLPGAVLAKILAQPFFAREQPTIPLLAALGVVVLTLAGGLVLVGPLGVGGIALAVSLAATAQAAVLGVALEKRGIARPGVRTLDRGLRIALASGIMGAAVALMAHALAGWFDATLPFAVKGSALGLLCLAGLAIYLAAAYGLGAIAPEIVSRARKRL